MNKALKNFILFPFNLLYHISPKLTLKLLYRIKCKDKLNLKEPKSYLEKLNWLKLFYRNDLMPKCADKYLARDYIKDCGFEEYLPKIYWQGFSCDEIPYDDLPKEFVIKVTSGSGNNIICKNKEELNKKQVRKKLNKWLKEKYLPCYGEWHYGLVKPRIIVEEFLSDGNFVPIDYKMFCFNNVDGQTDVGCIAVDTGRYVDHRRNIYDNEWNFLKNVSFDFKQDENMIIPRPSFYEEMRNIAKVLAQPFPHVRVDFFIVGSKFYLGELTFFNGGGFDMITPQDYNEKMGDWINLN